MANEQSKEKMNRNSIDELTSCAKQFTSMAIVQLKEHGKLNYDDAIDTYLPELKAYHMVTVRHLLNHTSGMPDYMQLMDSVWDKSKIAVNKDVVQLLAAHHPKLLFEPNTKFEYSNTGYVLLASIIEKLSGLPYATYLEKNFFMPLKISNSFIVNRRYAPKKFVNDASDNYSPVKTMIWLDGIVGDGTVNSTVNDLLKWDKALSQHVFISEQSKRDLYRPVTLNDETKANYGLGLFLIDDNRFGFYVSQSGGLPGYATLIERDIRNDKTIIILTNHDEIPKLLKALRHVLYSDKKQKRQ